MKKALNYLIVCLCCLLVGLGIAVQINRIRDAGSSGLVSLSTVKVYEEELQQVRDEKEASLRKLSEKELELEKFEKETYDKEYALKSILGRIEKRKMSAAVYDVEGSGIVITIEDPHLDLDLLGDTEMDSVSIIMSNYNLLISLVNDLKRSGAEAISINGQRILATTGFNYVGNAVYINGIPTAPPYTVKVIGDSASLKSQISIRYGIVDTMKNQYGLRVNVEEKKELQIRRYSDNFKFKYAKPSVEDE